MSLHEPTGADAPSGAGGRLGLLVRYGLAGGLTSGVYIVVYNLGVWLALERWIASVIAYACALVVQYAAHGRFTFAHRTTGQGTLWRYLVSVGFGLAMAAAVSQANTKLYTLPDLVVSIIVMVLVAISNFVLFNLWVYRHRGDGARP